MRRVIKAFGYFLTPAAKRFHRALENPQQAQLAVQQKLIKQIKSCDYAQHYDIQSVADWNKLPIVDYDALRLWINPKEKQSRLTTSSILFHEPTSGSSGAIKQIPYTRKLLQSFNHLFCVWAHDLIMHGPSFNQGKLYFSISPRFSKSSASNGTTDDADYLSPWLRWLLKPFLVIAPAASTPKDFKHKLAQTLLLADNLEIISVWSPSFLTAQMHYIHEHRKQLHDLLHTKMKKQRANLLLSSTIDWAALWPHLKLISCWDSVMAADGAERLRSHFPNTFVQGKGLLATECPMTVPLIAAKGDVPLLDEVYFEFLDEQGNCYALHELKVGETYEIVVSQMGGLTRYRMCDRVKVTHYFLNTPCLSFQGRSAAITDLVGEKLNLHFVTQQLNQLNLPDVSYQSLVAVQQPTPHYVLLLEHPSTKTKTFDPSALATQLDASLCEAFHYKLARQLDQLAPARVLTASNLAEQLTQKKARSGQRWGDVKHAKLGGIYPNLDFLNTVHPPSSKTIG
ncbi:MAG: GH3 auxin-responsive promoter family protein [Cyanobacteria bacterium J06607_10]